MQTKTAAKPKLTRAERNEDVKRRLFDAATAIVGRVGYAEASVARITAEAGVAQGTFYNHFATRQELLDELLPAVGMRMLRFIRERIDDAQTEEEREIERFRAFFGFIREVPEFLRILTEAELFAPAGYSRHLDNIVAGYLRILKRGRGAGVGDYDDAELEAIIHVLMGARGYLCRRYAYENGAVGIVPDHVITAYEKLIRHGLFKTAPQEG